jgi:hypothetical protein
MATHLSGLSRATAEGNQAVLRHTQLSVLARPLTRTSSCGVPS